MPGDVRRMSNPIAVSIANNLRAVAAAEHGPEPCANPGSELSADDPRAHAIAAAEHGPEPCADPGSELSADDPRAHSRTDLGANGSAD